MKFSTTGEQWRVLPLCLYFCCLTQSLNAETFHFGATGEISQSKPRERLMGEVYGGFRYWGGNEINLSFLSEEREFADTVSFTDYQLRVGHVLAPTKLLYIDSSAAYTFDKDFLPKWEFQGAPHMNLWKVDVSCGLIYRRYDSPNTWALRPGAIFFLTERIKLSGRIDWGIKPEQSVSGGGFLEAPLNKNFFAGYGANGGKADEGQGIFDDFYSMDVRVGYDGLHFIRSFFNFNQYMGDRRHESTFTLTTEIKL